MGKVKSSHLLLAGAVVLCGGVIVKQCIRLNKDGSLSPSSSNSNEDKGKKQLQQKKQKQRKRGEEREESVEEVSEDTSLSQSFSSLGNSVVDFLRRPIASLSNGLSLLHPKQWKTYGERWVARKKTQQEERALMNKREKERRAEKGRRLKERVKEERLKKESEGREESDSDESKSMVCHSEVPNGKLSRRERRELHRRSRSSSWDTIPTKKTVKPSQLVLTSPSDPVGPRLEVSIVFKESSEEIEERKEENKQSPSPIQSSDVTSESQVLKFSQLKTEVVPHPEEKEESNEIKLRPISPISDTRITDNLLQEGAQSPHECLTPMHNETIEILQSLSNEAGEKEEEAKSEKEITPSTLSTSDPLSHDQKDSEESLCQATSQASMDSTSPLPAAIVPLATNDKKEIDQEKPQFAGDKQECALKQSSVKDEKESEGEKQRVALKSEVSSKKKVFEEEQQACVSEKQECPFKKHHLVEENKEQKSGQIIGAVHTASWESSTNCAAVLFREQLNLTSASVTERKDLCSNRTNLLAGTIAKLGSRNQSQQRLLDEIDWPAIPRGKEAKKDERRRKETCSSSTKGSVKSEKRKKQASIDIDELLKRCARITEKDGRESLQRQGGYRRRELEKQSDDYNDFKAKIQKLSMVENKSKSVVSEPLEEKRKFEERRVQRELERKEREERRREERKHEEKERKKREQEDIEREERRNKVRKEREEKRLEKQLKEREELERLAVEKAEKEKKQREKEREEVNKAAVERKAVAFQEESRQYREQCAKVQRKEDERILSEAIKNELFQKFVSIYKESRVEEEINELVMKREREDKQRRDQEDAERRERVRLDDERRARQDAEWKEKLRLDNERREKEEAERKEKLRLDNERREKQDAERREKLRFDDERREREDAEWKEKLRLDNELREREDAERREKLRLDNERREKEDAERREKLRLDNERREREDTERKERELKDQKRRMKEEEERRERKEKEIRERNERREQEEKDRKERSMKENQEREQRRLNEESARKTREQQEWLKREKRILQEERDRSYRASAELEERGRILLQAREEDDRREEEERQRKEQETAKARHAKKEKEEREQHIKRSQRSNTPSIVLHKPEAPNTLSFARTTPPTSDPRSSYNKVKTSYEPECHITLKVVEEDERDRQRRRALLEQSKPEFRNMPQTHSNNPNTFDDSRFTVSPSPFFAQETQHHPSFFPTTFAGVQLQPPKPKPTHPTCPEGTVFMAYVVKRPGDKSRRNITRGETKYPQSVTSNLTPSQNTTFERPISASRDQSVPPVNTSQKHLTVPRNARDPSKSPSKRHPSALKRPPYQAASSSSVTVPSLNRTIENATHRPIVSSHASFSTVQDSHRPSLSTSNLSHLDNPLFSVSPLNPHTSLSSRYSQPTSLHTRGPSPFPSTQLPPRYPTTLNNSIPQAPNPLRKDNRQPFENQSIRKPLQHHVPGNTQRYTSSQRFIVENAETIKYDPADATRLIAIPKEHYKNLALEGLSALPNDALIWNYHSAFYGEALLHHICFSYYPEGECLPVTVFLRHLRGHNWERWVKCEATSDGFQTKIVITGRERRPQNESFLKSNLTILGTLESLLIGEKKAGIDLIRRQWSDIENENDKSRQFAPKQIWGGEERSWMFPNPDDYTCERNQDCFVSLAPVLLDLEIFGGNSLTRKTYVFSFSKNTNNQFRESEFNAFSWMSRSIIPSNEEEEKFVWCALRDYQLEMRKREKTCFAEHKEPVGASSNDFWYCPSTWSNLIARSELLYFWNESGKNLTGSTARAGQKPRSMYKANLPEIFYYKCVIPVNA